MIRRDILLLLFLGSFIITICGLLQYWNPNLLTLSQVYGNYNNKIYFFFLVNLFGMLCALAYEYTFKDYISMYIFFILAISYVLLLWISEDIQDTLRFKSHVVLSAIAFSSTLLYILYHAISRRDVCLYLLFMISIGLFYRIVSQTLYCIMYGLNVPDMFLEEITLAILFIISVVRRGGYF